jgi:hypothetical protein
MARTHRVEVIRALRATVYGLEQDPEIPSDDPDLATLKSILVRRMADFEGDNEFADAKTETSQETLSSTTNHKQRRTQVE